MSADRGPEELLRELRDPEYWRSLRTPRPGCSGRTVVRLTPARVVPAIAALVIAVLAVTGIGVGFGMLHRTEGPAVSPSPSATPDVTPSPSTAPPAFTGVVPGATRIYDAEHEPPTCALDQLQLSPDRDGGGAAGTYIHALYLRNSGNPCTLPTDLVRVGTTSAPIRSRLGFLVAGGVLNPGDVAALVVSVTESCGPTGTVSNIDKAHPVPIVLGSGVATEATGATFPQLSQQSCSAPFVIASMDAGDASRFGGGPALTATLSRGTSITNGSIAYSMLLRYSGTAPVVLQDCLNATEIVSATDDPLGHEATRSLVLSCRIGSTLQPGAVTTLRVTTRVPFASAKGYLVSWYIPQQSAPGLTRSTCTLAQLRLSEPAVTDFRSKPYVQDFAVRNTGAECELPVSSIRSNGTASDGVQGTERINLPPGDSVIRLEAPSTCPNGRANVIFGGPASNGIAVTIGGRTAFVDQNKSFPNLACGGVTAARRP